MKERVWVTVEGHHYMWEFVSVGPNLFRGAGYLLGVGSGQWKAQRTTTMEKRKRKLKTTKHTQFNQLVNNALDEKSSLRRGTTI